MTIKQRQLIVGLSACAISFACGGGSVTGKSQGPEGNGGAGSGGSNSSGGYAGEADGGTAGGGTAGGGTAGGGGSTSTALFTEDFEDGNFHGWYGGGCVDMDVIADASANGSAFGARVAETREDGCDTGDLARAWHEFDEMTPSRIQWWMRSNSAGDVFGSFEVPGALFMFVRNGMILLYDGEETEYFDVDGEEWHRYEFLDIDWTNQTYSMAVDGEVIASGFAFYERTTEAIGFRVGVGARKPELTDPVSVDIDEVVFYE